MANTENEFEQIVTTAKTLNQVIKEIEEEMMDKGFSARNSSNINQSIRMLADAEDKKAFNLHRLDNYQRHTKKLSEQVLAFEGRVRKDNYLVVSKQRAERKAERADMWKLWAQKLARWGLGIVAAVLIYSALVAAQTQWSFIKIPVRDMLIPDGSINSAG